MAAFYAVVIEPRPEFAAKGRQTPTGERDRRRGLACIWLYEMEPRREFAAIYDGKF